MIHADLGHRSWSAYGAAVWALVFGVLHLVWATGWYVGLEVEFARKAFAQPWFLAYDLAVAGICFFAVAVALALARAWGRRLPRWTVGFVAWAGLGVLMLRSVGSLIQVVHALVNGSFVARPMHVWELWFYLGTILFALATWRFATARQAASRVGRTGEVETIP